MSKYLKLIQLRTPYNKRITRLRNRIFGDVVRQTNMYSMKPVQMFSEKPIYMREEIVDYYPRHTEIYALTKQLRKYGLYRDEYEDFKAEMKRLRTLRGKVKPKKGEGKQATNK